MSEKRFWWMTLEERQKKSREKLGKPIYGDETYKARKTYSRGLKDYLRSYKVEELREYKETFDWRNLQCVASRMQRDYGCVFRFFKQGGKRYIARMQ